MLVTFFIAASALSQSSKELRLDLNHKLYEIHPRLRVQSVLLVQGESVNLVSTRKQLLELGRTDFSKVKMKTGPIRSGLYELGQTPKMIREFGRIYGTGVMFFFIGYEIFHLVAPFVFAAVGQPEVGAAIVAFPEMFIIVPTIVAAKKIGSSKRESIAYGSREKKLKARRERANLLSEEGMSSFEKDTVVGAYVVTKKRKKNNPDALNFRLVKKLLKKNDEWDKQVSRIAHDSKWNRSEKSILLLALLEAASSTDAVSESEDSELEKWAIQSSKINEISMIRERFESMPRDTKTSTLLRLWKYVFFAEWIKHMNGKKVKPFRCLSKNDVTLAARADQAGDRFWNAEDEKFLKDFLSSCDLL